MEQVIFSTSGNGWWSREERDVRITDMRLGYIDRCFDTGKSPEFGELRVYFDRKTWNIDRHGLIYTDRLFERQLREFLDRHGLPGKDVTYSEQGMQGDDYVSLDVGKKFLKAWGKKFDVKWEQEVW